MIFRAAAERAVITALLVMVACVDVGLAAVACALAPPTLDELVHAYFRASDAGARASLIEPIERACEGSSQRLAQILRRLDLWAPLARQQGTITLGAGTSRPVDITYRRPEGYDCTRRHPLIVCMPDDGASPSTAFCALRAFLGDAVSGHVMVAIRPRVGGSFHQSRLEGPSLPKILREVRRRLHIDTDRVSLFGRGRGGDAAWMAAITHPELFSHVAVVDAYPRLPYAAQTYSFMLHNSPGPEVLSIWKAADEYTSPSRVRSVASHNRLVEAVASRPSFPVRFTSVPLASSEAGTFSADESSFARRLSHPRPRPPRRVSKWFRYPHQGRAGWLRQVQFKGDVWRDEQLSILPAPRVDRDAFITGVIQGKLAYLGGRVEGQTITIETRRCARIELSVPQGLVDLDKPVTVLCNGRKRFEGVLRRSVRTLLEAAYRDWEFEHLPVARLSLSIKTDGSGGG